MGTFFEDDYGDMYEYFPGEFVYGDDYYVSDEYMDEKWWYIEGFPGYIISDYGRVWSTKTQRFIKPKHANRYGHLMVSLCIDGDVHYRLIHRLVAEAFLPNPYKYPIVRHLDDDPTNNCAYNLAWGTQKDNVNDCIASGNANCLRLETPVIAINIRSGEELYFRSQSEAGRKLGVHSANIFKVLTGERTHTQGWKFVYARGLYHD